MHSPTELKRLLAERGLAPRRQLGQNFLIDANLVRKLINHCGVRAGDAVLEVGPGAGALTQALLDAGVDLLACELDAGLAALLRDRFADPASGRFTLIEADCLAGKRALSAELDAALDQRFAGRPFSLIANLPYGAATPLIATLLLRRPDCRAMFVTIQSEVADRLLAQPRRREYGELSVITQALAEIRRLATLPPTCFWPAPKVTSAMIAIERRSQPLTDDPDALLRCCERAFSSRRKQLGSLLGRELDWPAGVQPTMRAEQLSVEQFEALRRALPE